MIDMFKDFNYKTTRKEKQFFFCTLTSHSILQFCDIGFPFYFMKPLLLCKQNQEDDYQSCSYIDACTSQFKYRIDEQSANNLAKNFQIVCENEYYKQTCIQIILCMGACGTVFLLLNKIKDNRQFYVNCLKCHIIFLLLFQFQNNALMSAFFLGLAFNFIKPMVWANFWIYSKQVLSQDAQLLLSAYDGFTWSVVGIIIPIALYLINSNIYMIMWIIVFIQMCLLYTFQQNFQQNAPTQKSEDLHDKKEQSGFQIIQQNPFLAFNIFILSANLFTYLFAKVYIMIELQSFGGNMYLNLCCCEFCGIWATIGAFQILRNPNVQNSQKRIQTLMGIILLVFFFKSDGSQHPVFIILMISFKFLGDMMFALNMKIIFDYLPIDVIQIFFAFNGLCNRTILILLPSVSIFIQSRGIHPLFIYGIIILIIVYLRRYMKPIELDGEKFVEVNVEQRKSILNQIQMQDFPSQSMIVQRLSQIISQENDNTLLRKGSVNMTKINSRKQSNI